MDHHRENAWLRHQQCRWLRPDAHRWVRTDAHRFITPGKDLAKAFPALARKYSPDQPRVPAGSPDGGQWTDGTNGAAASTGESGFGDLVGRDDFPELFQITPYERGSDGVQLAGDPPVGDSPQEPPDEPPEIPNERPETRSERMDFVRSAVSWIRLVGRYSSAASIFLGALDQAEDLRALTDAIKTADDPPATLEELQARAQLPSEAGYEDHHIVGQFAQNRLQFGDDLIDSPENKVRIPISKHRDINGYYSSRNEEFNGLSLRDYLRDKSWDEQMREGVKILRDKGVLK